MEICYCNKKNVFILGLFYIIVEDGMVLKVFLGISRLFAFSYFIYAVLFPGSAFSAELDV